MSSVLILCTGNSCRSQMAEGLFKMFAPEWEVYSAGTAPTSEVHPLAVKVMAEIGIDLSANYPKSTDEFMEKDIDYVITVCDHARETCPVFTGKVKNRLHIGFRDPAEATGTDEEIIKVFREVRDEIKTRLQEFYSSIQ